MDVCFDRSDSGNCIECVQCSVNGCGTKLSIQNVVQFLRCCRPWQWTKSLEEFYLEGIMKCFDPETTSKKTDGIFLKTKNGSDRVLSQLWPHDDMRNDDMNPSNKASHTYRWFGLDQLPGSNNLANNIKHAQNLACITSNEQHSRKDTRNTVHNRFCVVHIVSNGKSRILEVCLNQQEASRNRVKYEFSQPWALVGLFTSYSLLCVWRSKQLGSGVLRTPVWG